MDSRSDARLREELKETTEVLSTARGSLEKEMDTRAKEMEIVRGQQTEIAQVNKKYDEQRHLNAKLLNQMHALQGNIMVPSHAYARTRLLLLVLACSLFINSKLVVIATLHQHREHVFEKMFLLCLLDAQNCRCIK